MKNQIDVITAKDLGFKLVEYQTVKENKGNMLVIAQK